MSTQTEPVREIATWAVALLSIAYLLIFVGFFVARILDIIGIIMLAAVAILAYNSQGKTYGGLGITAPSLHRDLAKTHCGSCGAPMRSNMTFCPVCGAQQTKT